MSLTAKLILSPVLVAQAIGARSRLPRLPEPTGERAGVVGRGQVLRQVLLLLRALIDWWVQRIDGPEPVRPGPGPQVEEIPID